MLPALPASPKPVVTALRSEAVVKEEDTAVGTAVPSRSTPEPPPPSTIEAPATSDYLDIETNDLLSLLMAGDGPMDETADLDAFWDTSLTDDEAGNTRGISLEEALQRGLIDFNQDDELKA